jgi:hypothetical protein
MLAELKVRGRHPTLDTQMTVGDAFRRMGAEQWDAVSARFRAPVAAGAKHSEAAE